MFSLIDADILLWKAAISAETEINWGGDVWTLYADVAEAKRAFEVQVKRIEDRLDIKEHVFCLSDPHANFRKVVDPTYKSNRRGTRKPVGFVALCDWVKANFKTFSKPTLEADDCLGILATMPSNVGKCIIVSDDKDLKTIKGKLYRPMSDELLTITEAEADRNFLIQCLKGDPVDGIKGIPGVGDKKAETILGSRPSWGVVEAAYIKAGMTRDDAIRQARLVRILRWSEWHPEIESVRLWTP
jgi:DNA polymerase-1